MVNLAEMEPTEAIAFLRGERERAEQMLEASRPMLSRGVTEADRSFLGGIARMIHSCAVQTLGALDVTLEPSPDATPAEYAAAERLLEAMRAELRGLHAVASELTALLGGSGAALA
jgi:hypothetical protein